MCRAHPPQSAEKSEFYQTSVSQSVSFTHIQAWMTGHNISIVESQGESNRVENTQTSFTPLKHLIGAGRGVPGPQMPKVTCPNSPICCHASVHSMGERGAWTCLA